MMRFFRSGTRGEIHGSTRSSARSMEFGLRFLVCNINQNVLDRFDNQRLRDRRWSGGACVFQDFICLFQSSIHIVVAVIIKRHYGASEVAQAQLPLASLFNGLDTIMTKRVGTKTP